MNIEKRLTDHMNEFADRVEITSGDGASVAANTSNRGQRAVTVVTAALVLLLGGAGFLMLSNDSTVTTSVAAGQDDQTGDVETGDAEVPLNLEVVDVTSPDAPTFGQGRASDGVYYVLSTAPGLVETNQNLSDAEWNAIYRPNTFYVLDQDQQWHVNTIDDRFVSDFSVDDGVLYVLSTGTINTDTTTLGSSSDNGASWSWETLDQLPPADNVTMFADEGQTLIYASRWDRTDYEWAIASATDAGIAVSGETMQWVDQDSFSYYPVDGNDRCMVMLTQFLPGVAEMTAYAEQASTEAEVSAMSREVEDMLRYFREESQGLDCGWDLQTIDDLEALNPPAAVTVQWEDIGVTTPEEWRSWQAVYSLDGGSLIEKEVPFGNDNSGWGQSTDGALEVVIYTPDDSAPAYGDGTEVLWRTTDGENWTSEQIDPERNGYYGNGYLPAVAGGYEYRIWWDESQEIEYQQRFEEAQAAFEAGDLTEEEAFADLEFNPSPLLQRSRPGGEWETVDPSFYNAQLDLGNRVLQDVRGSSIGLVLIFGHLGFEDGQQDGSMIAVTNDGVNWKSFEVVGFDNMVLSAPDSMLILSHDWVIEPGADTGRSEAFLVRQAG